MDSKSFDNVAEQEPRREPPDFATRSKPQREAQSRRAARDLRRQAAYEQILFVLALAGGLPAIIIASVLLWTSNHGAVFNWSLMVLLFCSWLGCAFALRRRVLKTLYNLFNILSALREGDFSTRAGGAGRRGALGGVLTEVNALGEILQTQRFRALEATALLRTVMMEIDVAIFTFDREEHLVLVNRAGERLLAQPAERLLGRTITELHLAECFKSEDRVRTLQMTFPGAEGRWEVRRSSFRSYGEQHQLLVLSDVSRALREEERQAWQRLVRVLGHELNNSLAPIKSIAGSLENLIARDPRPSDWHEDMQRGLSVISTRAEALSRFMSAYAQLARLPSPHMRPLDVHLLTHKVIELEDRLAVTLIPGPEIVIQADGDQLEQALINLMRNAVDAALETGGAVFMGWEKTPTELEIWIEDEGPGFANTKNLFVPFFTTKPEGSGIGLALSRQIAEVHGGTLTLENRRANRGCKARLRLPL
jgi:two-component system nitrogen regulation sensor histidine kinase NtrY